MLQKHNLCTLNSIFDSKWDEKKNADNGKCMFIPISKLDVGVLWPSSGIYRSDLNDC